MDTFSASRGFKPRAFEGWALEAVTHLDEEAPGTLRKVMCGSPLRRQAVFLALSYIYRNPLDDLTHRLRPLADPLCFDANSDAEIAHILTTRRVRDIVHALFGPVQGLVGALSRLGDAPLHSLRYRRLVDVLRHPTLQDRAKVLRQLEVITPEALTAVSLLDRAFLHPEIIRCFKTIQQTLDFNSTVKLIRRLVPNVSDDDLVASLKALRGIGSGAGLWAERWLSKAVFENAPLIQDDHELTALRSAEAMIDAGTRHSNCLKSKIPLVAVGRAFYLEFKPDPAIIELVSLSPNNQWAVEDIYSPSNGDVSSGLLFQVLNKLQGTGILLPARLSHAQQNNGAARLMHVRDFGVADFGLLAVGGERLEEEVDEFDCEPSSAEAA